MKAKKCKIDFKRKGKRVIMTQKGYCDEKDPNKKINREMDIPTFERIETIFDED